MNPIMKKIFRTIVAGLFVAALASCDLSEYNPNEWSVPQTFDNAETIQVALNTFYRDFPSVSSAYSKDGSTDYVCTPFSFNERYSTGYDAYNEQDWSGWSDLRAINFFLDNLNSEDCGVTGAVKDNFEAQGCFFRAFWYYKKMITYGDLPWFDRVILYNEPDYEWKDRDSRDVVMKNILDDLDYAIAHITATSVDATTVTKNVCLFIKMQACLYEASFRKYNKVTASAKGEAFSNYTVDQLYRLSAQAAEEIINGGQYSLIAKYRELFTKDALQTKEVILGAQTGETIKGSQNQYYNSPSNNRSFVRTFINTYLMKDGTPYTDKAGYETETFAQEFQDRDPRLSAIVRTPGYKFSKDTLNRDKPGIPMIPAPAPVGYHIIKFCLDDYQDGKDDSEGGHNTNSTPIYRYAEVLLSYAEAKAELGEMNNEIWAQTVGAIRKRAGITGGLNAVPTVVDPYMKANFYPDVTDAAIMEIRRERGCELCLEGQRENDVIRWGQGNLLADLPWTGINIPALDTPVDIDGNGTVDYYFSAAAKPKSWDPDEKGVYVQVNAKNSLEAVSNGSVYQLRFNYTGTRNWDANNRLILAPIPQLLVDKYKNQGYVMTQNPGY